jgi:hypothetical protein
MMKMARQSRDHRATPERESGFLGRIQSYLTGNIAYQYYNKRAKNVAINSPPVYNEGMQDQKDIENTNDGAQVGAVGDGAALHTQMRTKRNAFLVVLGGVGIFVAGTIAFNLAVSRPNYQPPKSNISQSSVIFHP